MTREPLNKSARSAFQSEKLQIVWGATRDSSRSAVLQAGTVCPQGKKCLPEERSARYDRVAQRARCGFSGETLSGRAFAGPPPCLGSLIWNDQTTFAQAKPETPAKAPSRPRRLVQRFPWRNQRGGALLIALIAAALASVIALGLIERGQGSLARTQALLDTERSFQYALGMDLLARDLIEQALSDGVDPALLNGAWTPPFDVPGGMVQGRLLDQAARFNLNALGHHDPATAARALAAFERLLAHLGLNPVIALELADWIEGASVARPGSAGNSWYASRQPPYRLAGTPLTHVSELRWLRSVDDESYRQLLPVVSALPVPDLVVNVNTCPAVVLASLVDELTVEAAERIVNDGPFADIRGFLTHPNIQALPTPGLERHLTVVSRWYLAQARVNLDGIERDYFRLINVDGSGYDFRWFSQGVF